MTTVSQPGGGQRESIVRAVVRWFCAVQFMIYPEVIELRFTSGAHVTLGRLLGPRS